MTQLLRTIVTCVFTDVRLPGILFLHLMNAWKITSSARKNLQMFQSLVGEGNMATTMWDDVKSDKGAKIPCAIESRILGRDARRRGTH